MKIILPAFIAFALLGCSQLITETETLLVCEGDATSIIAGLNGKDRTTFTITKIGDKVTRVKTEYHTYTLDKVDISTKENKGPIYIQLIVETDKLVLRSEITEDKRNSETIIFNNGAYKQARMFGWAEGQCTVSKKAF